MRFIRCDLRKEILEGRRRRRRRRRRGRRGRRGRGRRGKLNGERRKHSFEKLSDINGERLLWWFGRRRHAKNR
jgi:hypothetical protein